MSKSPWVEKTKKFGWWRIWLLLVQMLIIPLIIVVAWDAVHELIIIGFISFFLLLHRATNQRLLDESNDYHFKEDEEKDL